MIRPKNVWPGLQADQAELARQIHSIPATSAGIERQFSIASLTLTDRRSGLDPEQLDNILCIRAMSKLD
ncbi:unnamed protein product, partial [Rotaria sp. Silwood2]